MWPAKKQRARFAKETDSQPIWTDRLASTLARAGTGVQKAFVQRMERWTASLSLRRLKTALVVFCLLGGGISSYLILSAARGDRAPLLRPENVQWPRHIGGDRERNPRPHTVPDLRVLHRIRAFRRHLDSLRKAGGGHYDSVLAGRPGLLDSLQEVENIYEAQLLK